MAPARWTTSGAAAASRWGSSAVARGKKGAEPGSEVRAFVPPRSYMRAGFDEAKEAAVVVLEAEVSKRMEALFLHPKQAAGLDEGED